MLTLFGALCLASCARQFVPPKYLDSSLTDALEEGRITREVEDEARRTLDAPVENIGPMLALVSDGEVCRAEFTGIWLALTTQTDTADALLAVGGELHGGYAGQACTTIGAKRLRMEVEQALADGYQIAGYLGIGASSSEPVVLAQKDGEYYACWYENIHLLPDGGDRLYLPFSEVVAGFVRYLQAVDAAEQPIYLGVTWIGENPDPTPG